jgi:hypothetical protein
VTPAADSAEPVGVRECVNCHQVRRVSALRETACGWQCAEPCRNPGGRPVVGPPVLIRMAPELRAEIEGLALPGEKLAATARRLLSGAVAAASRPADPEPGPASGPPARLPSGKGALPETGKRVVLAYTWRGEPVVIGPVYTPKGAAEIEAKISGSPEASGWRVTGTVRLISKADLEWSWES